MGHWSSGAGSLSSRRSILVRAVLSARGPDGSPAEVEGWGECPAMPEPTYSADYLDGEEQVLERFLVPALLRSGVVRTEDVRSALAGTKGHHPAKASLEGALLDAETRLSGTRTADWLASRSASGGRPRERVPAGVAIGLGGPLGRLVEEVGRRVEEGYRRVKLKIRPGWDREPLAAVRQQWPALVLFADANGAYAALGPEEAAKELAPLSELGLAALEQPLGDDDLVGHARFAELTDLPVCLDEALPSVAALGSALRLGACRVANIKASRMGGYLNALSALDVCTSRGVPAWCGGMVETGVGRAANLALASLPGFSLPGDLSASGRFFAPDIVVPPLVLGPDGDLALPAGAGSGVDLDARLLDRASTRRTWLGA